MLDPHAPARMANEMGASYRLRCKYEWDRSKQSFRYHFYRKGILIGGTSNPRKVVEMMESYIGEPSK